MALGSLLPGPGQGPVGAAPLGAGGQLHHRRPGEGMAERQAGGFVDADQLGPLGRVQVLEGDPPGRGAPQYVQVAGAVQGGQQEQVAGGRR